ncbi:MAG TPA: hypothetical protein VIT67_07605, partial [Povalibacter sp.]
QPQHTRMISASQHTHGARPQTPNEIRCYALQPYFVATVARIMLAAASILKFVSMPLKTAPMLVIVVFSALLLLAMKASLLGIPLAAVLLTGFCNYSFILLDSVADNAAEPPVLSIEMMNPVSGQRTLILLIIIGVLIAAAHSGAIWLGGWFYLLSAIVSAMILPAMIAVQAVTGSALQALNLRAGFALIWRLGSDYLLIVAFMAAAPSPG